MMTDRLGSPASPAPYAPRVRSIACRQCRSRKTRCSGELPCAYCKKAHQAAECEYPRKDRHVKVSQRYVDELIAENQELRARASRYEDAAISHVTPSGSVQDVEIPASEPSPHDSMLVNTPWFVSIAVPHTPILLSEASDSAFATRFRQAVSASEQGHFPRMSYPPESHLQSLSDSTCAWPSLPEARLLINASVQGLGRWHHVVRRSLVLKELKELGQTWQQPTLTSSLQRSKLWALFAVGKMHATRTSNLSQTFPGLKYFAKATEVLREMSERPTIESVEICLLLSYYSLCLNRRHSAYNLAGLAVRTGVIMGLHLDGPANLLTDPAVREHRKRVWWTAYIFERMWAAKLGYPVTIQDDDIGVGLPSTQFKENDFADPTCMIAMISLSKISGQIIRSIYGGNAQQTPLSHRVNDCMQALREWHEDLPPSLKLHSATSEGTSQAPVSLHLLFNQLTILATRPILLHVFSTRFRTTGLNAASAVPVSASALCETCIRCARNSKQILIDAWFNGSFMLFDYFYTQNLFITSIILAISSLLDDNNHESDLEHLDALILLLSQLRDSGNFVAAEFKQHIDAIKPLLDSAYASMQRRSDHHPAGTGLHPNEGVASQKSQPPDASTASEHATAPVLSEPFFYDLLAQPLPDLDFIDASLSADNTIGFY